MRVLVRVDMGDSDTGLLQSQDLRDGFLLDMGSIDSTKIQVAYKLAQVACETGASPRLLVGSSRVEMVVGFATGVPSTSTI